MVSPDHFQNVDHKKWQKAQNRIFFHETQFRFVIELQYSPLNILFYWQNKAILTEVHIFKTDYRVTVKLGIYLEWS